MKKITLLLLLLAASYACAQGPAKTTIADTVYAPNGALLNATLRITNATFTSADGYAIPAGSITVNVVNGVLNIPLVPTAGANPAGQSYKVDYFLSVRTTETWTVPNTGTTNLAGVRALSAPIPTVMLAMSQINPPAGCLTGQVPTWNTSTLTWTCTTPSGGSGLTSLNSLTGSSQTFGNDTNVTMVSTGTVHQITFAGTLAAGRLNSNVVQAVTNDTNITGSIGSQNLTLSWAGTLAKARMHAATAFNDQANTFASGAKQTVQASATTAGFNFGGVTSDPSSLASGDHWYRTDINKLRWRDSASATHSLFNSDDTLPGAQVSGNITGNAAGLTANIAESQVTSLVGDLSLKVATSRNILTSAPLSGGGDLSADRTISISDCVASGASHARGTVPDPGVSAGTTRFLREDCSWAAPPSGFANPMTAVGDLIIGGASGAGTRLAGDTSNARKFLMSLSSGGVAAAEVWTSLLSSDVALGSVTNDAQTKAAIVPNTAPSAGQILAGNAGGTAYAPVSVSGDITITSAGVTALKNTGSTGTYLKTTFDAQGRETSGTTAAVADLSDGSTVATKSGIQNQSYTYLLDSGVADAYVITLSPAAGSYSAGQGFTFKAANANATTTPTLNVNALGTKTITKLGTTALAANDIKAGCVVTVVYDGTQFQMTSPACQSSAGGGPTLQVEGSATGIGTTANLQHTDTAFHQLNAAAWTVSGTAITAQQYLYPAQCAFWGDSLSTFGTTSGGTNLPSGSGGYATLMALIECGGRFVSAAQSSDMSADLNLKVYSHLDSPILWPNAYGTNRAALSTIMIGTNEANSKQTSTYQTGIYRPSQYGVLTLLSIPRAFRSNATDANCTATGTWTADNQFFSGLGKKSNTNGDKVVCTGIVTTAASPWIYFGYGVVDGNAGVSGVKVDGVACTDTVTASSTINNFAPAAISTTNGATKAVFGGRCAAAAGTHSFEYDVTSATNASNVGYFEWVGSMPTISSQSSVLPRIEESDIPQQRSGTNATWTTNYTNEITSIISTLAGDTMPIQLVAVNNLSNDTSLYTDGIHWDDAGHRLVHDRFAQYMQGFGGNQFTSLAIGGGTTTNQWLAPAICITNNNGEFAFGACPTILSATSLGDFTGNLNAHNINAENAFQLYNAGKTNNLGVWAATELDIANNSSFGWSNSNSGIGTIDTRLSKTATGAVSVDGATAGNHDGTVTAKGFISPNSVHVVGQTATKTIYTLCAAATAGCNVAGQYEINWYFNQGGTACATPGSGGVTFALTWVDNAGTHSAVALPMNDASSLTATGTKFTAGASNTAAWASGSFTVWSTGASAIQVTNTYTACTSGTLTWELAASVNRIQ